MINKIGFLLVKPQLPENIGFSARGLKNFGFKNLDLVSPKETWPNKKAITTSVGAKDIFRTTKVYSNIKDAINKYDIVYASSARIRDINKRHLSFNKFIESVKKNKKKKLELCSVRKPQAYLMMIYHIQTIFSKFQLIKNLSLLIFLIA